VILTANTTSTGVAYGLSATTPLQVGLHNFHSFAVGIVVIWAVTTGFGRRFAADEKIAHEGSTAARG
jgi:hypothetical protein